MYEIKAVVGRRSDLNPIAACDSRFCVVDLALEPFALLPLDDPSMKAIKDLWDLPRSDAGSTAQAGLEFMKTLARRMAAVAPQGALALVDAEFFGGAGQGEGVTIGDDKIVVFAEPDDPWPETNISRALKSIGVPERLDDHLDAFDVVGLGRFRRVGQWRATITLS